MSLPARSYTFTSQRRKNSGSLFAVPSCACSETTHFRLSGHKRRLCMMSLKASLRDIVYLFQIFAYGNMRLTYFTTHLVFSPIQMYPSSFIFSLRLSRLLSQWDREKAIDLLICQRFSSLLPFPYLRCLLGESTIQNLSVPNQFPMAKLTVMSCSPHTVPSALYLYGYDWPDSACAISLITDRPAYDSFERISLTTASSA